MGFFRSVAFDVKYLIRDIGTLIKHPTREMSRVEVKYGFSKLYNHIIGHPWYALKRGIRNLWIWFPTIWRNDSWDYCFMLNMMDKQLKEMEELWESKYVKREREYRKEADVDMIGWRCQHARIWKRIRWTRKLMAMWRDEHYAMKWYDIHSKKFPRAKILERDDSLTKYDEYGIPILFTAKPMPEDEKEHYRSGSEKARLMDEKCFKLWVKNLGYVRNWWH